MKDNPTDATSNDYNFLTNQALGEDLFKNKSQDKIATVISEKVINEPKFKIIGIDGTWGSGKSNLVHLIQKKLIKTHSFFIYDVWGHQEDEQRHAILLELTDFITKENIIDGNGTWDKKLKILNSKQKHTTTTNIPHLSIGFILSLFLIIYIPSVNTFVKDKNIWIQLTLVLFPLIILLILFLKFYYEFLKEGKKEGNDSKLNWKKKFKKYSLEASQKLFKVYQNQKVDETKIEVISENEPTVKEFRSWMNDIDNDLNQPIVIVFDNFDRLPKKHIQSIWSSIHIFFAEVSYKNIKVILPFDRDHVQNAFKDLNNANGDKTFGDDYINKTFDIVFRVTLPIMSDWKDFFESQWNKAFRKHDAEELQLVIQIYEFLSKRTTPREIIAFINEILTIKLLDENLKERYIAIFVLMKEKILEKPLDSITNLDYLNGLKSLYYNDEDYGKQLTAIIYHIDVENALELIYTQELKDSLNKGDIEKFNSICDAEFINSFFISTITQLEVLENPINTLASLKEDSKLSNQLVIQTWKTFYHKTIDKNSEIENLEIFDWQINLIKNSDDDQYLKMLLYNFKELINDQNVPEYINLIDKLKEQFDDEKLFTLLNHKTITAKSFIELVETRGDNFEVYKLSSDSNEIDNYLSQIKIDELLSLKHSKILCSNFVLPNYTQHLKTNLETFGNQNEIQKSDEILRKLKELAKGKEGTLIEVLSDAIIFSLYNSNLSSSLSIINDLIAMRIARGDQFTSSYVNYFESALQTVDIEKAANIAATILNYIRLDDLIISSHNLGRYPLFMEIISNLFRNPNLSREGNINEIIKNYGAIKSSLKIEDDVLLKEISRWNLNKSELVIKNLNKEFLDDCFVHQSNEISKKVLEKFNEEFLQFNEEELTKIFDEKGNVHFKYFEHLESKSLTQSSLDVFESKFLIKLEENKSDNQWWDILKTYDQISELSIVNVLKNIRDKFSNNQIDLKIETAKNILSYFIRFDLLDPSKDIFRTIIKNSFLSDDEFVDILLNNVDYLMKVYKASTDTQKDGFKAILNQLRDENPKLEELAKKVGVKKSIKDEQKDNNQK